MELAKVSLTSESLLSLPKQFYPWFDVCHVLLCVLTVRKECGKRFARDHPAAALLSCVVSSFTFSAHGEVVSKVPSIGFSTRNR